MCIPGTPSKTFKHLSPAEGIRAWRTWRVDSGPPTTLVPTNRIDGLDGRVWRGRVAKATTRPDGRPHSNYGLHALPARRAEGVRIGQIAGQVRLFGRVVEYRSSRRARTGYLAEYAEILSFSLSKSREPEAAVRSLAAIYGVKVVA